MKKIAHKKWLMLAAYTYAQTILQSTVGAQVICIQCKTIYNLYKVQSHLVTANNLSQLQTRLVY